MFRLPIESIKELPTYILSLVLSTLASFINGSVIVFTWAV